MLRPFGLGLLLMVMGSACSARPAPSLATLSVYSTSAAVPWLSTAYDCTPAGTAIVLGPPDEADVILRLTEPRQLVGAAFQVGSDDLLVVTHPEVAVGQLSRQQVEAIFAGQLTNWTEVGGADAGIQVWGFAPTVDVQAFFERTVLEGRPLASTARLALSAQNMSDSVGVTLGSIGILPRRWKAGNTREALIVDSVPVLALTDASPHGAAAALIACMQSHR